MEIHEYTLPNADTRPRRVAIDPDDVLWYSDYSRGYLGRFDPKTHVFQSWKIPGGGGVVRNMMPDTEGNLVIAESGLNMVGLMRVSD